MSLRVACFALLGLASAACDPPCQSYWREMCRDCGETSGACAHAKEVARATLDDEATCGRTVAGLRGLGRFGRARVCASSEDVEPNLPELTRGPFICDGVRVTFESAAVSVGDERFETYDIHSSRFGVKMTASESQYCEYHLAPHEMSLGEVGLFIHCTVPLGGLSSAPTLCLREHSL